MTSARLHFIFFAFVCLGQNAAAAKLACAKFFETEESSASAAERFRMQTLSSLNLSLQPAEPSDEAAFIRLRRDPRVFTPSNVRLPTEGSPGARYADWFHSPYVVGGRLYRFVKMLRLRSDPEPVGYITGYIRTSNQGPSEAMIGYALDPDAWGYGLMSEALERLIEGLAQSRVTTVNAWVFAGNERSERTLRSLGFQQGRLATLMEQGQFLMTERRPLHLWSRRLE